MKTSRYSDSQILAILEQAEALRWRAWPANCLSPLHLPIQNQTLKDFLWVSDTPFMLTGEM